MDDILKRAEKAYKEHCIATEYDIVFVNHDNEDSDHWSFQPPLGEAGHLVEKFAGLLRTGVSTNNSDNIK